MKAVRIRWRNLAAVGVLALFLFLLYYSLNSGTSVSCSAEYWKDWSMVELNKYCNHPDIPMSGQEGGVKTEDGKDKYQLKSVHVVIRHGDRFHLHSVPNYNNVPFTCKISQQLKETVPEMTGYVNVMEKYTEKRGRESSQTFHGYSLFPDKELCTMSLLTPEGATQQVRNGRYLQSVYLDRWNLLDDGHEYEQVLVRSTTRQRTFQSAVAFMYGFLPQLELEKLTIEIAPNNSMCTEKSGHVCHCANVVQYKDAMSANFRQRSPHLMSKNKVRKVYSHFADVLGVSSNSLPPISHIVDIGMIHYCHKQPLPMYRGQCIQPWAVRDSWQAINEHGEEQALTKAFQRVARLKLQPLMYEMAHRMQEQAKGLNALKVVLYSGHDTTVGPLLVALGAGDGHWPPYASRISIELYTRLQTGQDETPYFRVLHDGHILTHKIPFCQGHLAEGDQSLCPLERFLHYVDQGNMADLEEESYTKACEKPFFYV